jgi:hypothetical protein
MTGVTASRSLELFTRPGGRTRRCLVGLLSVCASALPAQPRNAALSPLTIPSYGICVSNPRPSATDSVGGQRRHYLFKVDALPTGTRLLGIGTDSLGKTSEYTETTVAMDDHKRAVSHAIAARISATGAVSGFDQARQMEERTDSLRPSAVARTALDSAQQQAVLRVAEWVRRRCVSKS